MIQVTKITFLITLVCLNLTRLISSQPIEISSSLNSIQNSVQTSFEVYDQKFSQLLDAKPNLAHLAKGIGIMDGKIYFTLKDKSEEGYLLYTNQYNDQINIIRWDDLASFKHPTEFPWSEAAFCTQSEAITRSSTLPAADGIKAVKSNENKKPMSLTDAKGNAKAPLGFYFGTAVDAPTEKIASSDGSIWCTDLSYQQSGSDSNFLPPSQLYKIHPSTGNIELMTDNLKRASSIAFSPDEKVLYLADLQNPNAPKSHAAAYSCIIYAFDVINNGDKVINQRCFIEFDQGFSRSIRVDREGNIYLGGSDGVYVYDSTGQLIGKIRLSKAVQNIQFAGKEKNILFIASWDSLWAVKLKFEK